MMDTLECSQVMPWQELPLESTLHLLIVEDVIADVELMLLALEAAGIAFTYDTASHHIACQQLLQEQNYDAVLAGYRLPELDSLKVLELVKQSGQEIPLILVTGALGEEAAVEYIKAGMTDYVLKKRLFRLPMVLERSLQEFELRRQKQADSARIRKQAQREQLLNQISRKLNSRLDPEYILQEIVRLTGECFGVDRVVLFTFEAEQIQVLNEWRVSDRVVSMLDFRAPTSEWPELLNPTSEFRCRRAFHAPDYAKVAITPARLIQLQEKHTLSVLNAPIFICDQLFGSLSLQTTTAYRTFTEDEINLMQGIADQAAIALYNNV